jgi:hypothetical protein
MVPTAFFSTRYFCRVQQIAKKYRDEWQTGQPTKQFWTALLSVNEMKFDLPSFFFKACLFFLIPILADV